MNNKLRVAIYLRLSDEDKDKSNKFNNSESIKNQRNMLIEEIDNNDNYILIGEYCDENLSGAGTYRPEFERMIKDCKNKKIDIILAKSQSRFSRDIEIIEKYLHNKFIEWNVRFIGLTDNIDTANIENKKARQINGLVNEWYLEDISKNIRSAFKTKMKHGEFISPFAPFGYKISNEDNNKLIIDTYASQIVKKIFKLYLKGYGFTGIAKYLNQKNIPSPSLYKYNNGIKLNIISTKPRKEIKWSITAIKTILKNEIYLGHLIQGKRTTINYKNHKIIKKNKREWIKKENTHDPIINKIIFTKVQSEINKRKKTTKSNNMIHIFSGKVYCLECKHYMRRKVSKKNAYLFCPNNCNNKASIRYDVLEKIILEKINNKIIQLYDETYLINKLKTKNNYINNINILEKQKKGLENKILNNSNYIKLIYEEKINKIINNDEFIDLINSYKKEKQIYIDQIKYIENQIKSFKIKKENIKNVLDKYKRINNLNRNIVEEFIKFIYVGKINTKPNVRDILIKWNF